MHVKFTAAAEARELEPMNVLFLRTKPIVTRTDYHVTIPLQCFAASRDQIMLFRRRKTGSIRIDSLVLTAAVGYELRVIRVALCCEVVQLTAEQSRKHADRPAIRTTFLTHGEAITFICVLHTFASQFIATVYPYPFHATA